MDDVVARKNKKYIFNDGNNTDIFYDQGTNIHEHEYTFIRFKCMIFMIPRYIINTILP